MSWSLKRGEGEGKRRRLGGFCVRSKKERRMVVLPSLQTPFVAPACTYFIFCVDMPSFPHISCLCAHSKEVPGNDDCSHSLCLLKCFFSGQSIVICIKCRRALCLPRSLLTRVANARGGEGCILNMKNRICQGLIPRIKSRGRREPFLFLVSFVPSIFISYVAFCPLQ